MIVFGNEVVDMVNVMLRGIEINDETLPLGLMEKLGPKASYLFESHTRKHFRTFWAAPLFDRSFARTGTVQSAEERIKRKTIELIETHQPKPLPDATVRELKKVEKAWFDRVGLKHEYPRRPER